MDVDELHSTECINLFSNDSSIDSNDNDDDDISHLGTYSYKSLDPVFLETCDDTSMSTSYETPFSSVDIQILKEMNSDSKNCQKSTKLEDIVFHDFDKIEEEALQICDLLPEFKYKIVYKTLLMNCKAKNRIELSLWDLLPSKRPKVIYDMKVVLNKTSNSRIMCENKNAVLQTNCKNLLLEHLADGAEVSSRTADGRIHPAKLINQKSPRTECVTSANSFILSPSKLVTNNDKHLKTRTTTKSSSCVKNYGDNKVSQKHVSSTKNVFMSKSTKQLVTNNNNPEDQILFQYMQYLKYMCYVKQEKSRGVINSNFDQRNKIRKIFLESHGSNVPDIDIIQNVVNAPISLKREQTFSGARKKEINGEQSCKRNKLAVTKNIDLPSNCQRVDEKLALIFPQIDKNSIIKICTNLLRLTTICSSEQLQTVAECILTTLIDFAGLFAIIKANTRSSDTTTVTVTNSNSLLSHHIYFNDSLSRTNSTLTEATSDRPSTFARVHSISETKQVFGGARKKKIKENRSDSNKDAEKKNIVLPLKFEEMYETLLIMYPQFDQNLIRQTCKNVSMIEDICSIEQLKTLAIQTIQNKMQSAKANVKSLCQQDDENGQYTYLSGIFPDADPAYLKKVVARTKDNLNEIENFVQTQWDNPTYPTKQEKVEKIKITQQQMQCMTNKFDVKQFLEIFPDPVKYFTNPKRVCKFNSEAVTFLTSHFSHFEISHVEHIYMRSNYNLTFSVQELENMPPHKKLARNVYSWEKCLPEDISLLQECTFIIHRDEIEKYLNKLKEVEMKEFQLLKSRNELLECQCCYDSECMPSKCSTCDDGHIFCNSCILKGTESQLGLGNTRISCFSNCDGEFTVPTLQKILPPTQFNIFIRKKQEVEVMAAGIEGLVSCPFCHFASIPPSEDTVFKCLNPECMAESCRLCKELNHVPLRCYEERSDQARLILEENMTEALVRKCYNCSKPYFKVDGCNKIVCNCGAMMCYICDVPINSYSHFSYNGCPLVSNNDAINNATVRAVADKTVKFLKKKDPHVDIRADNLLKNVPPESNDVIVERVNKIVKFDE